MRAQARGTDSVMNATRQPAQPDDTPPSAEELQAMAYADGELSREETVQFERRMEVEPGLVHLVAENHALDVLARRLAPREPADHNWADLRQDPAFRATVGAGWVLVLIAAAVSFALAIWAIATNSSISPIGRSVILGSLAGFVLLFLSVLWRRVRAFPLDPYRHVER